MKERRSVAEKQFCQCKRNVGQLLILQLLFFRKGTRELNITEVMRYNICQQDQKVIQGLLNKIKCGIC